MMRTAMLLVVGVALAGCDAAPTPAQPTAVTPTRLNAIDRSHAGSPAPAIIFERSGGDKVRMADFRGRPVLVNLWATWCAPCIAEMPQIDALAASRRGKLAVLPISQDMEGWLAVKPFFAKGKFTTLQPYVDQPGSFAESLKARGLPISILYDANGKEVWRIAGTPNWADLAKKGVV
jgi:thiol-disulfide isomerase/thioredoxin